MSALAAPQPADAGARDQASLWRDVAGLIREFWAATPRVSAGLGAALLLGNARVGLYLLAMGRLVDALLGRDPARAALWAAAYVGADALEQAYWPVKNALYNTLRDHSAYRIERRVLERAAAAPLIRLEGGAFFDLLQRASVNLGDRLAGVSTTVVDTGQVLLMFVSATVAMLSVHPIIPLLLALGTLPSLWFQLRVAAALHEVDTAHTTRDRIRQHLQRLLIGRDAAAEIRLFGAAPYLLDRWHVLRRDRARDLLAAEARRARFTTGGSLVSGLAYAAALTVVAALILRGRVSVGGYVTVATGALWYQGLLGSLISVVRALAEESRYLGDLFAFLRLTPEPVPLADGASSPRSGGNSGNGGCAIEARGVTFSYPGERGPALQEVSLRIAPGERIAIVGENGAGKTTLAKLLIGLYAPDSGTVDVDGAPAATPDGAPRSRAAAVFQDYAAFQLTLRENVGFGDGARLTDDAALLRACYRAGLDALLAGLPNGLDEYLGRQFGETDLSGGQWQRVALARAFFKDADLLLLDEPTAALDPRAELALFERFIELVEGKTAVMISHRLGAARLADRIVVLRDGRIVEEGHHDTLLTAGGEYARLFAAQAQWYR